MNLNLSANDHIDQPKSHFWLREDLTNYTTQLLTTENNNATLCTNSNICCEIQYEQNNTVESTSGQYRLIVFDGTRSVAQETDHFHWQVCGLVYCENDTLASCTENGEQKASVEFTRFNLTVTNVHNEYTLQPGLNVLNKSLQLVPLDLFQMNRVDEDTFTVACENGQDLQLKTLAMIQKVYDGR